MVQEDVYQRPVINRVVPTEPGVCRLVYGPDIIFYVGQAQNLRETLRKHLYAYSSGPSEKIRGYVHLYVCHFQFLEMEDKKRRAAVQKKRSTSGNQSAIKPK